MGTSLEDIYRQYFPALREKCRRMLSDPEEAQDVAQEALIRLWRTNPQLHPIQTTAWLYRTSTRLAIDRVRRRKPERRVAEHLDETNARALPDPESQLATRQLLQKVAAKVPPRELEVAILQRLDGLNQQELAEVIGISDRTARRLLKKFDERVQQIEEEV